MLNKNKITRITLALFLALNISFINISKIEATPVDSSYYNPYSHGQSFEKSKTFGANEESNSERRAREKREAEEAKKKAEEAKKKAEEEAKNKQNTSMPDASEGTNKSNHTQINDTKDPNKGTEKADIDNPNYINANAYKNIAQQKCDEIAQKAVQEGSQLKDNGARITDVKEICTAEALDQFAHCLAAYNSEGATPSNIDEKVIEECSNNYILVTRSTSTYNKEKSGILDSFKEAGANFVISLAEDGVIPDWLAQTTAEMIRELTWEDIAEEIAITGGLMALTFFTGGAGGVALLARLAQVANKGRKIMNKAGKAMKIVKATEEAKKLEKLASVEKEFVKRAKDLTGEKINNYKDAIKAVERKIDKDGGKAIDLETKTLEKAGKQIKALNEEKIHEGGKSLEELAKGYATKTEKLSDNLVKNTEKIKNRENTISTLRKEASEINELDYKKIYSKYDKINKQEEKIEKIKIQSKDIINEINEIETKKANLKNIDASIARETLDATKFTKFDKTFAKATVGAIGVAEGTAVATGIGTKNVVQRTVISNPNAHTINKDVHNKTIEQYTNESKDMSLTQEERRKAEIKALELQNKSSNSNNLFQSVNNATQNYEAQTNKIQQDKADILARR